MARIDLSEPYERYLKSQVDSGLFRSVTAAAENAIARQMENDEYLRIQKIHALIAKGESDIRAQRTIPYSSKLIEEIAENGKIAALGKEPIKNEVK